MTVRELFRALSYEGTLDDEVKLTVAYVDEDGNEAIERKDVPLHLSPRVGLYINAEDVAL